jgi:hypothetical protein
MFDGGKRAINRVFVDAIFFKNFFMNNI